LEGWRRELFGDRALELLDGQSALVYRNRRVEVVKL
jgi:ribonuclease D